MGAAARNGGEVLGTLGAHGAGAASHGHCPFSRHASLTQLGTAEACDYI